MKSQSNERPAMVQKLDSKTYVFNYNIVEKEKENEEGEIEVYYEYDQVTVDTANITDNEVIKNVINCNWDINQQLKLVNDYFAYNLGLETEGKYKTRYEDFLEFRANMKAAITKSVI